MDNSGRQDSNGKQVFDERLQRGLGWSPTAIPESPALANDGRHFKRKYTRRVEVPYTKHVKVQVRDLQKIVPEERAFSVKYPKVEEVEVSEKFDEPEFEVRSMTKYRPKEVWRKVVVEEEYDYEVAVTKTRLVTQPYTDLEEKEVEQKVVLQSTKTVWVPAFRIDEVEGLKIIEVEEFQEYQEVEHLVGERIIGDDIRTIETIQQKTRFCGNQYYPSFAVELEGLKEDSLPKTPEAVLEKANCAYYECFEGSGNEEPRLVLTELDLANEMFTVNNISKAPVSLNGWSVMDENGGGARNVFEFQSRCRGRSLAPGESISVYSGKDSDKKFNYGRDRDRDKVHWFNTNVWDHEGAKAYLFDPERNLVHSLNVTDGFKISTRYTAMTAGDGSSSSSHAVNIDMGDFPNSPLVSPRKKVLLTPTPTPKKGMGGRSQR
jgi:hypothetical protein